ncbi:MAG: hypothetical protein U0694_02590 [Anaerolineae bacterium]
MPYHVQWLAQDRVIFERIWGVFDDNEAQISDHAIVELLDQSSASVIHLLVDISEVNACLSIKAVHQLMTPRHAKMGWLIVYGANKPFVRALLMLAIVVFNLRYRVLKDKTQALEFLAGLDALPQRSTS